MKLLKAAAALLCAVVIPDPSSYAGTLERWLHPARRPKILDRCS
jgi:hypothetical protein